MQEQRFVCGVELQKKRKFLWGFLVRQLKCDVHISVVLNLRVFLCYPQVCVTFA